MNGIVGVKGFEPSTPCSQSRCANRTALHPVPFSRCKSSQTFETDQLLLLFFEDKVTTALTFNFDLVCILQLRVSFPVKVGMVLVIYNSVAPISSYVVMRQQTLFAICLSTFWVATECYRFLQIGFAGLIMGVSGMK